MAIEFVAAASAEQNDPGQPFQLSVTLDGGLGSTLFASFRSRHNPVAPSGWTQLGGTLDPDVGQGTDPETGLAVHSLWMRTVAQAGPAQYTFEQEEASAEGAVMGLLIAAYSGNPIVKQVAGRDNAAQLTDKTEVRAETLADPSGGQRVLRFHACARASEFGAAVALRLEPSGSGGGFQNVRHRLVTPAIAGRHAITLSEEGMDSGFGRAAIARDDGTDGPVETGRRNAFALLLGRGPVSAKGRGSGLVPPKVRVFTPPRRLTEEDLQP